MDKNQNWRDAVVFLDGGATLSLGELVEGWCAHVRRLIAELDAGPEDLWVWGIHDYVAALILREAVERGLKLLAEPARAAVGAEVSLADETFETYTELDQESLLQHVLPPGQEHDSWWWGRIPVRGPARTELDTYSTS